MLLPRDIMEGIFKGFSIYASNDLRFATVAQIRILPFSNKSSTTRTLGGKEDFVDLGTKSEPITSNNST